MTTQVFYCTSSKRLRVSALQRTVAAFHPAYSHFLVSSLWFSARKALLALTAPAPFPDVFSSTGTRCIDYSCVDLPDKHIPPSLPPLSAPPRHPAIWNVLFSFSLIVLQTSQERRAVRHVKLWSLEVIHQVKQLGYILLSSGSLAQSLKLTNRGCRLGIIWLSVVQFTELRPNLLLREPGRKNELLQQFIKGFINQVN